MNGGGCSADAEVGASQVRQEKFAKLEKGWSPAQKSALAKLKAAAFKFFESYANAETDMSGTARVSIAIEARAGKEDELLSDLQDFEKGQLPKGTKPKADGELNAVYQKIMKHKGKKLFGTVTKDDVRDTQRAWLKYRDAWTTFGPKRYPKTNAQTWNDWATERRIDDLKSILGVLD